MKWAGKNAPNKAYLRTYSLFTFDSVYAPNTNIRKPRFTKLDLETSDKATISLFNMGKFNREIHEGMGAFLNRL
jgi:hypothetical protein